MKIIFRILLFILVFQLKCSLSLYCYEELDEFPKQTTGYQGFFSGYVFEIDSLFDENRLEKKYSDRWKSINDLKNITSVHLNFTRNEDLILLSNYVNRDKIKELSLKNTFGLNIGIIDSLFPYLEQLEIESVDEIKLPPQPVFGSLKTLNVKDVFLSNLDWLRGSLELEELMIQNCSIENIEILCNLKNLTILYLNNNQIQEVPKCFENQKRLKTLVLENNNLFTIDCVLEKLSSLENIYVGNNLWLDIPKFFDNLSSVSSQIIELSLSGCRLEKFPKKIFEFKKLQRLYLNNNHITEIPDKIQKLENLEELFIDDNLIDDLSPTSNLPDLEILSVTFNKIEVVDVSDISSSLRTLQIYGNKSLRPPLKTPE
jgi:Leucine-rich repeat (LRR) protein